MTTSVFRIEITTCYNVLCLGMPELRLVQAPSTLDIQESSIRCIVSKQIDHILGFENGVSDVRT